MPQFTIPEETFSRLAERAAALNLTVEQLVLPVLDQVAPRTPSADERKRAFEELTRFIQADRYPLATFWTTAARASTRDAANDRPPRVGERLISFLSGDSTAGGALSWTW